MITIENLSKRYETDTGYSDWILRNINLQIPSNVNVGLIGKNGAGKSTLIRLIGGLDTPSTGKITVDSRISWPMNFQGGMKGNLTGKQNAKFILRIHGIPEHELPEKLEFAQQYSELGKAFDDKINTYSSGMKSRLNFSLSLAFDFNVYLADEILSVGDAAFRKKITNSFLGENRSKNLILVSHNEATLLQMCEAGIYVKDGGAIWFDNIRDALKAYGGAR
ncbi:ABC transporter ATP-binding protein [Pseudomethylobacillus aquaticus]|uniref:ABC transporter ATP-binding protein n=1 Tax=Pseudomethylobacillus aquaticus TaxID=2676064 RepID=A0A3N0V3Q2_9PROT|nr:ABC transporter ATP-binding protein [Pseudomethylobacillus aquaticus]ROH87098.1 ABC transporter ATP-binding protein [Pseudomethylobacillus aquaticus]